MEINDDAWMDEQYDKKIDSKINRITDLKLQQQETKQNCNVGKSGSCELLK